MTEPRNADNTHEITGQVDYAIKKKYRWISESGKNTCEKCKSLDGKVFELKDLPKRPHPNCKCRVEEISIVEGNVAKLYGYRDEKFNLEIDAKEILGDLSVIKKKVHNDLDNIKYSEIIEKKEKLLNDIDSLSVKIYNFIDALTEFNSFGSEEMFQKKSIKLMYFSSRRKEFYDQSEYLRLKALQLKFDDFVEHNKDFGPDAAALWKLSSSKFTEGMDYIKHNGYIVNNISELHDFKLENTVRNKINGQYGKNNSRGIVLNKNSSLAISVINSSTLDKFIKSNLSKILEQKRIDKSYIESSIFVR